MGQGSGSSSSAPQIVDEEALALTGKSKVRERERRVVRRTLTCQRSSALTATRRDTLPPSAQTGRRATLRWSDLQRWMSSAGTWMRSFA